MTGRKAVAFALATDEDIETNAWAMKEQDETNESGMNVMKLAQILLCFEQNIREQPAKGFLIDMNIQI